MELKKRKITLFIVCEVKMWSDKGGENAKWEWKTTKIKKIKIKNQTESEYDRAIKELKNSHLH